MIAVTVGAGGHRELAEESARSLYQLVEHPMEVRVLGEAEMGLLGVEDPALLRFKLFDLFPEHDDILYFDADWCCLQKWCPEALSGPELVVVRDINHSVHVQEDCAVHGNLDVDRYFNSGFMILNRQAHVNFLALAESMYHSVSKHKSLLKDQGALNAAAQLMDIPVRYLDRRYNWVCSAQAFLDIGIPIIGAHKFVVDEQADQTLERMLGHTDRTLFTVDQDNLGTLSGRYLYEDGTGARQVLELREDGTIGKGSSSATLYWLPANDTIVLTGCSGLDHRVESVTNILKKSEDSPDLWTFRGNTLTAQLLRLQDTADTPVLPPPSARAGIVERARRKRWHVLSGLLPKDQDLVGAEIGVYEGEMSRHLLSANSRLTLYMVDSWDTLHTPEYLESGDHITDMTQEQQLETMKKARRSVSAYGTRARFLRLSSQDAPAELPELDFVFLDADHSYPAVSADIPRYWAKVKPGGILAGHDYDYPTTGREKFGPDVKRAVDEFSAAEGLALSTGSDYVWWVYKPMQALSGGEDVDHADMVGRGVQAAPYYQRLARDYIAHIPDYPEGKYEDRGIVICAGGPKYFTCAWVCVQMLRKMGCTLPVEFWHLGSFEMDDNMRALVAPLGVTCVDAHNFLELYPVRSLGGWELNPYAMIHSSFEEIIFLDADNVPVVNPEFLFDTPQYQETGAIFWPDYLRLAKNRPIWDICGVQHRDEPEFESGQVVLDKRRVWREIQLTMHLNNHSDFYYQHVHGDKETYHMAWHILGTEYSMPSRMIDALRATMCQHDFDNRRIFQHRNMAKWQLTGTNPRIKGFLEEDACLVFLKELASQWDGVVRMPSPQTEEGQALERYVGDTRYFTYHRVGYDKRSVELLRDHTIGQGSDSLEKTWYVVEKPTGPILRIAGGSITCELSLTEDGSLKGAWVVHEKMPVELLPLAVDTTQLTEQTPGGLLPPPRSQTPAVPDIAYSIAEHMPGTLDPLWDNLDIVGKRFIYIRVGHDKRVMRLEPNGKIGEGSNRLEQTWSLDGVNGEAILNIGPSDTDVLCSLTKSQDGVWRGAWNKYEKMPIELVEVPG